MGRGGVVAEEIGCVPQALHEWVKKAEINSAKPAGVPTEFADKVKAPERKASAYFAQAELDRPFRRRSHLLTITMMPMGGEPICRVLPIAPSTYHEQVAQRQDPSRPSVRVRHDSR